MLAPDFGPRLVLGGRNLQTAEQPAGSLGHGVEAVRLDANEARTVQEAIAGVGRAVACKRLVASGCHGRLALASGHVLGAHHCLALLRSHRH